MDVDTALSPNVTTTNPKGDWSYLSEGGASMVFSYVGPSHPTYNGTVLRLRKSQRENVPARCTAPNSQNTSPKEEPDDPSVAFQNIVTSRLVPGVYLPKLQNAIVSTPWLKDLESVADGCRPTERASKDGIDTSRCKAVLATDLVGGRGWAVEIKPKWAFLPSPVYLSPSTRLLKMQHCRFCMHTYFKAMKQDSVTTGYCPLDLFSGDEARVRKALGSLWKAWVDTQGKGNNLRLFNDGKVVDPGDSHSLSTLTVKLMGTSNLNIMSSSPSDLLPSFIEAVLPIILSSPVISILAHLQRTLDSLDIEGLSQAWSRSYPGVQLGQGEPDPTLAEWDKFVGLYLSGGKEGLRYYILAYLLSATFKDCSLLLRPGEDHKGYTQSSIAVIDLDPKSVNRLFKWEALDQDIVKAFAEVADQRMTCIDALTPPC